MDLKSTARQHQRRTTGGTDRQETRDELERVSVTAGEVVTARADTLNTQAAHLEAGQKIDLEAQHRRDQALALHHTITERGKRHRHEEHHITHALTTEKAPIVRDIAIEGLNKREATHVIANRAIIVGQQGVMETAARDSHTTHTETTVKKRGTCGMGGSSKTTTTETLLTQSRGPVVESYTPHTKATVTYAAPEGSILLQQLTLGKNVLARLMAGGDIFFKAGESTLFKATLTKKEGMVWNSTTQDQEGHTIPKV